MLLFLIFLLIPSFCCSFGKQINKRCPISLVLTLSSSSKSKILLFCGVEEGGVALYFRNVHAARKQSVVHVHTDCGSLHFPEIDMILAASSLICSQIRISSTWLWLSLTGPLKGQQLSTRTEIIEGLPLLLQCFATRRWFPQGHSDTHSSRKLYSCSSMNSEV